MKDKLEEIFARQYGFQEYVGYDFVSMTDEERVAYIKEMFIALQDELFEALAETRWKPWAKSGRQITDRKKFGGELVDAFHFLINLFLVNEWSADDVYTAFVEKNNVNVNRQAAGYDHTTMKCANSKCRRALDEPGNALAIVHPDHTFQGIAWCSDTCYDVWRQAGNDLVTTIKEALVEVPEACDEETFMDQPNRVEISPNVTLIIGDS